MITENVSRDVFGQHCTIKFFQGVSMDVANEISDLKDGLLALTTRVVELESKSSPTVKSSARPPSTSSARLPFDVAL